MEALVGVLDTDHDFGESVWLSGTHHCLEGSVRVLGNDYSLEASVRVLGTDHGLEAGVELDEEGRLLGQRQHALLNHRALDVIVLNDHVFLEDLDRVQLVRAFPLR